MALFICPECAHMVSTEAEFCPGCGTPAARMRELTEIALTAQQIEAKLDEHRDYLDHILDAVDSSIMLDEDQRRAVVADEGHTLLIAGAGAGKTTTMAAKVKYLVDKCQVKPEEILVVSYTNKAIDELRERINKALDIPARIDTFHAFAFDFIRHFRDVPPELNYSSYRFILDIVEKTVFHDQRLLINLVLFLGNYFDLTEDALYFADLESYHQYKANQQFETLRSSLDKYVRTVAKQRGTGKNPRTVQGEFLRSAAEVRIANFLYLYGLDYEYELVYPYRIEGAKKKYTPDFRITQGELSAYLEHYALTQDGDAPQFSTSEVNRYRIAVRDKRALHSRFGTKLLETYSDYRDGRDLLEHLREALVEAGFTLTPRTPEEVYRKLVETSKDKYVWRLVKFLMGFIAAYKTAGYDAAGFKVLREKTDNPRSLKFLDIAERVYLYYQEQLKVNNLIDFEDMILDATFFLKEVERQGLELPYRYIIIDEFQDIARSRFDLARKLSEASNASITAVGDDWQSIFAFAGSEVPLFTRFIELMGEGVRREIVHTYRNSQELIDMAGGFIQQNPEQIAKHLVSPKKLANPIVIQDYDDSKRVWTARAQAVEVALDAIFAEFGSGSSVLLIGRYNFDAYQLCQTELFGERGNSQIRSVKYPRAKLTFLTAHSSKGLGFDNVIIVNANEDRFGFPSQIEDDPIMKLVQYEDTTIPFAEERRLFYVALTRTKNRVYIVTPQKKPSRFVLELIRNYRIPHSPALNMNPVAKLHLRCPTCGYPLKREYNQNYGLTLFMCTNEPELCDFMTNDEQHALDIFKCSECDDGYMIVRRGREGGIFFGCTNFFVPGVKCKHMETIKHADVFAPSGPSTKIGATEDGLLVSPPRARRAAPEDKTQF